MVCKCVFYRRQEKSKGDMNFEGLEIQKWNIPTDRTWRVDEKNGVIFLVIMFTPGVMVIFVFFADDNKILVTV